MQRHKPLRHLRAEQGECGQAAKSCEMARPGVVADKHAGGVQDPEQFTDGVRGESLRFTGLPPPSELVGIAKDADGMAARTEFFDEQVVALKGPDTDRLGSAGMDENHGAVRARRELDILLFFQRQVQSLGDDAPIFVAMFLVVRDGERVGEKNLTANAGEAEAGFGAGKPQ